MPTLSHRRARAALLVSVVSTVALYAFPMGRAVAYPLVLLSTLAHELGHGLAALLVGGSFEAFVLYADGSGAAMTAGDHGRLARAFISAGGLCGPALAASGCFVVGQRGQASRRALLAIGLALIVALILVIRNLFGWFFVAVIAFTCLWGGTRASRDVAQLMVLFVGVQLALSVFSRADYLFTNVAATGAGTTPSDVAQMAEALFLPYWFWGLFCGGLSIVILWFGLRRFIRSTA